MLGDLKDFYRGQPVLVTGASGFIGWHVARTLAEVGARVRALVRPLSLSSLTDREDFAICEGDLLDRESLDRALRGCRFLFHVAGDYRFWAPNARDIFSNN